MGIRNAYGDFSRYYDYLGWNKFARSATVRIKSFIKLRGVKPDSILDLACGTGELSKGLGNSGIRFVGVDASAGMLKEARKKCPGVKFLRDDAASVRLNDRFDMVLFLFDSANHMNSLSHLKRVFKNARRHLNDDGYFIFDILTDIGLERWEHMDIRRTDNYTVISNGYYYPDDLSADIFIEAFVKQGKKYDRVYQKVVEKTYPPADIFNGLTDAGFSKVLVSSYNPDEELEEASRLWFVCS
ncbi:MAG: class I SAM-dependent methyltransferase [candidate division Zixibacteria bacterium]